MIEAVLVIWGLWRLHRTPQGLFSSAPSYTEDGSSRTRTVNHFGGDQLHSVVKPEDRTRRRRNGLTLQQQGLCLDRREELATSLKINLKTSLIWIVEGGEVLDLKTQVRSYFLNEI